MKFKINGSEYTCHECYNAFSSNAVSIHVHNYQLLEIAYNIFTMVKAEVEEHGHYSGVLDMHHEVMKLIEFVNTDNPEILESDWYKEMINYE